MAKAKDKAVEEPKEMVTEAVTEAVDESEATERFITRRLKVINRMTNSAKAKRHAERIFMNRKG